MEGWPPLAVGKKRVIENCSSSELQVFRSIVRMIPWPYIRRGLYVESKLRPVRSARTSIPKGRPILAVCQELEHAEHTLSEAIEEQEVGLMSISDLP